MSAGVFISFKSGYSPDVLTHINPHFVIGIEPNGDDGSVVHLEGGASVCVALSTDDVLYRISRALGLMP